MCIYNHILLLLINNVLKVCNWYTGDVIKFTCVHTYIHTYMRAWFCAVQCKEITVDNSQSVLIVSFCFLTSLLWLLLLVF